MLTGLKYLTRCQGYLDVTTLAGISAALYSHVDSAGVSVGGDVPATLEPVVREGREGDVLLSG